MAEMHYPPVQQALERIRLLSADEETRYIAMARERALLDERSELAAARGEEKIEGRAEGKVEGKVEGNIEGKASLLSKLLIKRFNSINDEIITRLNKATPEQLDFWGERLLDAKTIEAVFSEH